MGGERIKKLELSAISSQLSALRACGEITLTAEAAEKNPKNSLRTLRAPRSNVIFVKP